MDKTEIIRRKDLAIGEYRLVKELFLEHILTLAGNQQLDPKIIQGMLMIVALPDKWVSEFEKEIKRSKEENE